MRGALNFCRLCANERPAECLKRLDAGKSRKRGFLAPAAAFAIVLLGGAGWWVCRPYFSAHESVSATANAVPKTGDTSAASPSANEPAPNLSATATNAATWIHHLLDEAPTPANAERSATTVTDVGNIHLLFVTRPGTDSCMGLASRLYVTREAPNSTTAKLMTEVGPDMQTSFQEGVRYVEKLPRAWEKEFSVRLSFEDKFGSKDGGSAGTAFTVAMLAAVQHVSLDPDIAMTGDLTIDGEVQPVGAVVEKVRGAIEGKCSVTCVPIRNKRDIEDLALLDGTGPLWATQIFSITTVDEALSTARQDRPEQLKAAITRFKQLRGRLPAVVTPNYLQSPIVQSELEQVLKDAPNHLSAELLLRAAKNQLPEKLTLNRSVGEIMSGSYLFTSNALETEKKGSGGDKGLSIFPEREFGECVRKLNNLTPLLDKRSIELKAACINYASSLRSIATYKAADASGYRTPQQWREFTMRERGFAQQAVENLNDARSNLLLALRKLDTDGSLISEINKK